MKKLNNTVVTITPYSNCDIRTTLAMTPYCTCGEPATIAVNTNYGIEYKYCKNCYDHFNIWII